MDAEAMGRMIFEACMREAESMAPAAYKAFTRGGESWCADRYGESVERYRESVTLSHEVAKRWKLRCRAVTGFASAISSMGGKYASFDDDVRLLKQIGDGKFGDDANARAHAYFEAGILAYQHSDRARAARMYRLCLAIPKLDADVCTLNQRGMLTKGSLMLADVQLNARKNLDELEGLGHAAERRETTRPDQSKGVSVSDVGCLELAPFAGMALRLSRSDACDECGKQCDLDEKLQVCSVCKTRYYCSRECQTTAWTRKPFGHKLACRKLGELKQGDCAQLRNLVRRQDLNGRIVRIDKVTSLPSTTSEENEAVYNYNVTVLGDSARDHRAQLKARADKLVYLPFELRFPDRDDEGEMERYLDYVRDFCATAAKN
mmetsp:Transcript_8842/g.27164  ORF Transcript_8842/g.27164 Transcript_8842/m.27164 type:complete len:376 (-) Transcript_8842:1336-2463(-)